MEANTKTNTRSLAQRMAQRQRKIFGVLNKEEHTISRHLMRTARRFSSGPGYDKKTHPYAKADPNPPVDPAILNVNHGWVLDGWRVFIFRNSGGIQIQLRNISPAFGFLASGPNSTMIPRLIGPAIFKEEQPYVSKRLANAQLEILKG